MNTLNKSTVLLGGTFDPVTNAHTDLIKKLASRFGNVIVVPCKVSPFKTSTAAGATERLNMLELALEGIPNVQISTFELERAGTDYTYITVRHFAELYDDLYFCMGSEMVIELERWKNLDDMMKHCKLYVVPRPHFALTEDLKAKLDALSVYEIADFTGEEGSSSEVRVSVAMDRPRMFLSESVADYVTAHGFYRDYCYVNELYKRFNMKQKRIDHSFSTALCGISLAKRACVDPHKATTALLLHDIGKYTTKEQAEAMGVKFCPRIDGMPLPIRHAEIGAEILRQLIGITDNEIIEAVRWHTTGRPCMTALEKVVYLADYIEPLRDFPTVDVIRKACEKSIDDGLLAALENSVKYVDKDEIYPITLQAYEYYKEKK